LNVYLKTFCITVAAVAIAAAVSARSAEPTAIVLPTSTVTNLMQYLNSRPYQEVAGIVNDMQRCLQDQLSDAKGLTAERGNCPELGTALRQLKVPLSTSPTPPNPSTRHP
jgi:hypothetical protein